jgi:polysaccharide biosynthesis protein PslH
VTAKSGSKIRRRRILWMSHFLPWPPKGGLMQRSYYLMRELARHHEVSVVAFRQRAHQPDDARLREAKAAIAEFAQLRDVFDLPEDRRRGGRQKLALRSLLPGPPYTIRWGVCAEYREAVRRAMAEFQPELVHFDTLSLAPYLDLCGEVPAVLNHHNIESHMLLRRAGQETNLLKKFYFWQEGRRLAAYERDVARRFSLHLVCADLDGERLVENVGPVPVQIVPNGVDLEYFQPIGSAESQQPETMIFVGGLSWYPNASAMRFFVGEVWPKLVAQRPDAQLRIIGRNPPVDLATAAELDPRIKVMGFVDDIRPVVAESMVYVCPIYDGGGTKLKMIDAMAMGKAIVAHPVAAEGLGLQHGRDVLLSERPEELATFCLQLFDDPGLRQALGNAARKRAEDAFGFDAIGTALARIYTALE